MSTVASYFDHSESTGYKKDDQGAGRICLVEERKAAGCAIRNLLVKQGYQIDYYDAMEAALAALQSQPFDLLITDLHLNDSSAHWDDLIRRVRIEHEQTRQFLPILVLTSDAEADTLARVFRAGANDFVAMPARAHELCARVEHLIRLHHTLQSLTRQTQIPKLVGTVCYVHPAQSPYANLVQKLGKIGLRVDHYQCADEAFRAVVDNDYSFVITDLELFHEGMNGDDLAHAIRTLQNERFHNLAVVLVIDCEKKATLEGKNYAEVDAYFLTSATEVEISSKLQKLIPSRSAKEPQKQTVVTNVHPHRSNKLNQSYPGANPVNHLRMETRDPIGQVAENFQPRSKKTREDYKAVVRSEYKRIINWIIQHPWLNLLIMMIVLLATSSGVKNIELVADYRIFFGDDNPELIAFDKIENTYAKNFSIMFVATPKNGDVFTNETLKIIYELTAAGWLAPFASRVDSITNFQHSWSQGDELVVADLVDWPG
jgi:DNA-binding response OmpR family regulator